MGTIDDIATRAPGTTVSLRSPSASRSATAPSRTVDQDRLFAASRMDWVRRFIERHVKLDRETLSLFASVGSVLTTLAWVWSR